MLLPADAESDVTGPLELPRVEALKVAHHGSADPGLPALLARTQPAFAAIEVGRGNTYGHPTPTTLAALRAAVPRVVRTDRDGTVRLRVRGAPARGRAVRRSRPRPPLDSAAVPAFKPAYLVLGDDHGRISERRAKLRALAEAESGAGGVEVLEGDLCTAEEVVAALSTMTFALGRRFVIADGVERWKDADVEAVAAAMRGMDGETLTLAMFGREEGRAKVPDGLRKAVEAAGGAIAEESGVKPWELPSWVQARARELGLELDKAGARALVAQVGERQQRLLRELEKLALEHGHGAALGEAEIEESSATSARAQDLDARRRPGRGRREGRHAGARRAARAGRAAPRPALPIASRLRDAVDGRRGARGRPAARPGPAGPAHAAAGGRANSWTTSPSATSTRSGARSRSWPTSSSRAAAEERAAGPSTRTRRPCARWWRRPRDAGCG